MEWNDSKEYDKYKIILVKYQWDWIQAEQSHRPVSICLEISTQSSATKYKNLPYLSSTIL